MKEEPLQFPQDIQQNSAKKQERGGSLKNQEKMSEKMDKDKNNVQNKNPDNDALFQIAYGERKNMNIANMREYMEKRKISFSNRQIICKKMRIKFEEKQKYTKNFMKNLIKYFQEYVSLYRFLEKSLSKFQLKKKYQEKIGYAGLRQAVSELISLNQSESENVNSFIDWIEKILIQALKSSLVYYRDRLKKMNKEIEKNDEEYESIQSKQHKTFLKLSEGNDLLQKQLLLMEKIKNTNDQAIMKMAYLYECWDHILDQDRNLKKIMSENILQFYQRLIKFHKKNQDQSNGAFAIYKYWSKLPQTPSTIILLTSILNQDDFQFINFGNKTKKMQENFQPFMRMILEEKRIGNPFPYLDILIGKKFKSKLQKNQREWFQVKLIFTVDHNLLIINEKQGKVLLKLIQSTVKSFRISQNMIEVQGEEEGIIFNSKKKQTIHFETLDQVEEFTFFLTTIPEPKT